MEVRENVQSDLVRLRKTSEGLEVDDEFGGIADNFSRSQSAINAEALTEVLGNHYAIDRAIRPGRQ